MRQTVEKTEMLRELQRYKKVDLILVDLPSFARRFNFFDFNIYLTFVLGAISQICEQNWNLYFPWTYEDENHKDVEDEKETYNTDYEKVE